MTATWAVVIPTNRPERFEQWMDAWYADLAKHDVALFICEDLAEPTLADGGSFVAYGGRPTTVLRQADWPWWVPRGTDMCRSIGMLAAYRSQADYIVSLDDDVLPNGDLFAEYEAVFDAGAVCSPYFDVGALTSFDGQMRGFPYGDRERRPVGLQVGGWSGVLDFDARTQLVLDGLGARTELATGKRRDDSFARLVLPVPRGAAVTVCAMNMAWRREHTPLMWQLPLLDGHRYARWGDIGAGLIAKRCMDEMGVPVVVNGRAQVIHQRASDPVANLERESPGIPVFEGLWASLNRGWDWSGDAVMGATNRAAMHFGQHDRDYARHFIACRDAWLAEFAEVPAS